MKEVAPAIQLRMISCVSVLLTRLAAQPWARISEMRFHDQLSVMAPVQHVTVGDTESFKLADMYEGDVTNIYVRIGRCFFECRDSVNLPHSALTAGVMQAFFAEREGK